MENSLDKQAEMAKLLYCVTSLASSADSLNQTMQFCLYAVCELTEWPIGHVFWVPESPDGRLQSTDVWRSPNGWDISELRRETDKQVFRKGFGLPGRVWQSQEICWIESVENDSDWIRKHSAEALGIEAAVAFPLRVGNRMRAVLEFFDTRKVSQSADIVMFINQLSESIGRVVERQEVTMRLSEAKDASERASRAKSRFLANISHELRTPLTAVLGMLQLSIQEDLPPHVLDYLQTARTSADSLLVLLNEILDFASLESEQVKIEAEAFQLRELLDRATVPFSQAAKQKGLRWQLAVDPRVPEALVGDPIRLRQVVEHLVDNAVKFTEHGEVRLNVSLENDWADGISLAFAISDTGPGISPEYQDQMLESFTQVDSSFSRRHGGAGLGLAICRALVDRLGGELTIESQSGSGCQFHFTIAFQKSPQASSNNARRQAITAAHELQTPVGQSDHASQSMAVLLAEDTPANQKVIRSILQKRGHRVTVASNGREVLEQLANSDFDVVIMDLQMPLMDGYQATAAIRERERQSGRRTPIVALTAHSTGRDRQACLQAGMDAYLPKPLNVGELISVVESLPGAKASSIRENRPDWQPRFRDLHGDEPLRSEDETAAIFDLKATMKRLGGDEDLLREFVDLFNEDAPRMLELLRHSNLAGDCTGVMRAAHSLKGLAANFGAASVVELASMLETSAKTGDLGDSESMLDRLSEAVTRLSKSLECIQTS